MDDKFLGGLVKPLLVEMDEDIPYGGAGIGGGQFAKVTEGNVGGEVVLLLDAQTDEIGVLIDRAPKLQDDVVEGLRRGDQAGSDRPSHDHDADDLELQGVCGYCHRRLLKGLG